MNDKYDKFLFLLKQSFSVLAGISLEEAPGALAHEEWENIFKAGNCSLVWVFWYEKYGKNFLKEIDSYPKEDIFLEHAIYTLTEAHESGDYNYILDLTADAIESLKLNLERN